MSPSASSSCSREDAGASTSDSTTWSVSVVSTAVSSVTVSSLIGASFGLRLRGGSLTRGLLALLLALLLGLLLGLLALRGSRLLLDGRLRGFHRERLAVLGGLGAVPLQLGLLRSGPGSGVVADDVELLAH